MARDDQVEEMEGVEISTSEPKQPLFTEQEWRLLDVYGRLEELQLEIALLKARGVLSQGMIYLIRLSRVLTMPSRSS
jgi:hypothetical protein